MSDQGGTLYGLGVGPGDPGLLTLRALEILRRVPVIFAACSSKNDYSLALGVVSPHLPPETKVVQLPFPMTRDEEERSAAWGENAERILEVVKAGLDAAFITIGDPLTYSTFGYMIRTLSRMEPGIRIVTVPGITAFQAAAARLNMLLAEDQEAVALVSGVSSLKKVKEASDWADTTVILKPYRRFNEILGALENGAPRPRLTLVSRVGLEGEKVEEDAWKLRGQRIDYLSLLLVKKTDPRDR